MTGSSSGGTVVVALADTGATYRLDFHQLEVLPLFFQRV